MTWEQAASVQNIPNGVADWRGYGENGSLL
jgi:hypothetical protein